MRHGPVWLARHYGRLWYFARHRFREGEYSRMRHYFAQILVEDLRQDMDFALTG